MIPIFIVGISILLDGLLTNYLPHMFNSLSYFTPLLTLISIFTVYSFYKKNKRSYFLLCLITGIIYDWLYTPFLIFNSILFLLIGAISKYIIENYEISLVKLILYNTLLIIVYEAIQFLMVIIFNLSEVNIYNLLYKISHSLLLNIIYGEILHLIIKFLPKKYKKININ